MTFDRKAFIKEKKKEFNNEFFAELESYVDSGYPLKVWNHFEQSLNEAIDEAEFEAWDNGYQCGFFKLDIEKAKKDFIK